MNLAGACVLDELALGLHDRAELISHVPASVRHHDADLNDPVDARVEPCGLDVDDRNSLEIQWSRATRSSWLWSSQRASAGRESHHSASVRRGCCGRTARRRRRPLGPIPRNDTTCKQKAHRSNVPWGTARTGGRAPPTQVRRSAHWPAELDLPTATRQLLARAMLVLRGYGRAAP